MYTVRKRRVQSCAKNRSEDLLQKLQWFMFKKTERLNDIQIFIHSLVLLECFSESLN